MGIESEEKYRGTSAMERMTASPGGSFPSGRVAQPLIFFF